MFSFSSPIWLFFPYPCMLLIVVQAVFLYIFYRPCTREKQVFWTRLVLTHWNCIQSTGSPSQSTGQGCWHCPTLWRTTEYWIYLCKPSLSKCRAAKPNTCNRIGIIRVICGSNSATTTSILTTSSSGCKAPIWLLLPILVVISSCTSEWILSHMDYLVLYMVFNV